MPILPRDLKRVSDRIVALQNASTLGWDRYKREFKARLPGGSHPHALPCPKRLVEEGLPVDHRRWRLIVSTLRQMEQWRHENSPRMRARRDFHKLITGLYPR